MHLLRGYLCDTSLCDVKCHYKRIYFDISHWRRLVKNIGWANQNIGGQKMVKSDKCMGISQLLGGTCPGCPPKSVPMTSVNKIMHSKLKALLVICPRAHVEPANRCLLIDNRWHGC